MLHHRSARCELRDQRGRQVQHDPTQARPVRRPVAPVRDRSPGAAAYGPAFGTVLVVSAGVYVVAAAAMLLLPRAAAGS